MNEINKLKSMNTDEFAEWLDKYGGMNDCPWDEWWCKNYCNKCPTEIITDEDDYEREYAWCELNNKCRFFKEMKEPPNNKQVIKMWLESECVNEEIKS